jgi:GntR family transcriptional regulator
MFQIDSLSRQPVYEQLIEQMERFILLGLLRAGDQLPSVRSLSVELSINPNTIQKAYGELDSRGLIYSIPGIGCFVTENAVEILSRLKRRKLDDFSALTGELLLAGISAQELIDIVQNTANGGVQNND